MKKNSNRNPKPTASKLVQIIELSEKDLKPLAEPFLRRIAGEKIDFNHNKTMANSVNSSQLSSESESSKVVELTKEDLAVIGGGMTCPWELCGANHNEIIVNVENSSQVDAQSELVQIVELTREDLAVIAAGISDGCPIDQCGGNHNEIIVNVGNFSQVDAQSELVQIVELTREDLTAIAAGIADGCPIHQCGGNHNETIVKDLEALAEPLLRRIAGAGVDLANHNETMASTAINNKSIQELSEDDLTLICGGRSKEDDDPIGEDN